MPSKAKQIVRGIAYSILLLVGLPICLRQAWASFGPPYINLSDNPRDVYQRLLKEENRDLNSEYHFYARLQQWHLFKNPLIILTARFFLRANAPRYSEAFLELAKHHLDDPAFAKDALIQAIRIDSGWNGEQAVGIFVSRYADEQEATLVCQALGAFPVEFASKQLSELKLTSHDAAVRACALMQLGMIARRQGNLDQAKSHFESAQAIMNELAAQDFLPQKEALKASLNAVTNIRESLIAPEIVGQIEDGSLVKLSDFRKKVVFLDFWGDW